ncbi:MAG: TIGR03088 family PEP-CTERM/XrtA system glycosyltransferase [Magnetococcales bacterium]|nr:TIGR03088 family PEP-CTERM/XrtA system glycosyltransferase [Magnetococcales bacterium]
MSDSIPRQPPLVVHLLYRFDIGGLETVLMRLLHRIPADRCRHAIIALTEASDFSKRLRRDDVEIYALHKKPGQDPMVWIRLWKLLRQLQPMVMHSYNLGTIEGVIPAALAGVPIRIHAEHGRDFPDLHGTSRKYKWLRRMLSPLIDSFVPVSRELEVWLRIHVKIPADKIYRIVNGVDSERFHPVEEEEVIFPECVEFADPSCFVIGAVGRLTGVKDHACLLQAFHRLGEMVPEMRPRLRLVLVGDGPLRAALINQAKNLKIADRLWMAGSRDDVTELMRGMHLFVLSSLAEGTALTLLEAMATGLPSVVTKVGDNTALVLENETGLTTPPGDVQALATAMATYLRNPSLAKQHGEAARHRAVEKFNLDAMVKRYLELYRTTALKKGLMEVGEGF